MFGRSRYVPPDEDPNVAVVEEILAAAASRSSATAPSRDEQAIVTYALWICACVTLWDAPSWLIYDVSDDGIGWRRVTNGVEEAEHETARFTAGGHADPEGVVLWLNGEASDPWSWGDGWGDWVVVEELHRRIRAT